MKYAKLIGGATIWEAELDKETNMYDLNIDDAQGDFSIYGLTESQLEFATEEEYNERVKTVYV